MIATRRRRRGRRSGAREREREDQRSGGIATAGISEARCDPRARARAPSPPLRRITTPANSPADHHEPPNPAPPLSPRHTPEPARHPTDLPNPLRKPHRKPHRSPTRRVPPKHPAGDRAHVGAAPAQPLHVGQIRVGVHRDPRRHPPRVHDHQYGGIFVNNKRIEYEHIVIDEAQDLCPLEVRVLLDTASRGKSVTIAGDRAQKMVFDNGFVDWPQLLGDAGLPHVEIQPLKVTYRSTRQIMQFSRHVLGPLADEDQVVARDGAEVSYFEFTDTGEAVAFLGEALRGLMHREPNASVVLIARYPQQADIYYEALRVAEVPRLRRVRREDFSFSAGIDITDVRQVKGLEFDYVVLLEPSRQNYPEHVQARHLLHIGATRAAYQLWLLGVGQRSTLLPATMVGEL